MKNHNDLYSNDCPHVLALGRENRKNELMHKLEKYSARLITIGEIFLILKIKENTLCPSEEDIKSLESFVNRIEIRSMHG